MPGPGRTTAPRTPAPGTSGRRYDSDQLSRPWSHYADENSLLIQRGNFFLVAESMLLVAYVGVFASGRAVPYDAPVARIVAGFGLALTAVWILISGWHLPYINHLRGTFLTAVSAGVSVSAGRPITDNAGNCSRSLAWPT